MPGREYLRRRSNLRMISSLAVNVPRTSAYRRRLNDRPFNYRARHRQSNPAEKACRGDRRGGIHEVHTVTVMGGTERAGTTLPAQNKTFLPVRPLTRSPPPSSSSAKLNFGQSCSAHAQRARYYTTNCESTRVVGTLAWACETEATLNSTRDRVVKLSKIAEMQYSSGKIQRLFLIHLAN